MDLSDFGVGAKNKKNIYKENTDNNLKFNIKESKKDFKNKEIQRYLPWFLKYQIKEYNDLIITTQIKKIIDFLKEKPKNKGILLYGTPGCGKTTTINLIGNHFNYEIFELNASDTRNKKSIEQSIGEVINQKSLFNQKKLILIDEVDGVSGTQDRGGVATLIKIIKKSTYPIFFTANDIDNEKIKSLKKQCIIVDFENDSFELLSEIAKKIFKNEKIEYQKDELIDFIENRNSSDIRGFINDIQAECINGKFIPSSELEIRNYKKKIQMLLDKIYYSYPEDALLSSYNTDIKIDDLFLYLEENTPKIYDEISTFKSFDHICKADVFRGRIYKWQYWRYLVYINFYLTYCVSDSKNSVKKIKYERNTRILKKWIYNNKVNFLKPRTKLEKLKQEEPKFIEKLAKYYNRSIKKFRSEDFLYFLYSYKNDTIFRENINKQLQIEKNIENSLINF